MQCNGMDYAWVTEDDNLWSVLKSVKIEISQQNHFKKLMNKVSYMERDTFLIIYKSIIRPIIDYGDSVWNPSLKKHIQMIENIQRRGTKLVPELVNINYTDRLKM